jgi:hypothetical protein
VLYIILQQLVEIHKILGNKGYEIATYVCGQDYSLKQTRNIITYMIKDIWGK